MVAVSKSDVVDFALVYVSLDSWCARRTASAVCIMHGVGLLARVNYTDL